MSPGTQIILSGTLTFGVPLALAVRDLIGLRRGPAGGGWNDDDPRPAPPRLPVSGGQPERRLPACLIEAANPPARVRRAELV